MAKRNRSRRIILLTAGIAFAVACGVMLLSIPGGLEASLAEGYKLINDRERAHALVGASGWAAPLLLIGLHVSQVLLAPIPGDAFCVLGGYLFGAINGFLLSTIGMTIGSLINFSIGRFLGDRLVRRMVSAETYEKYNSLVQCKGILFIFIFFLVPGFPKDVLCLLLGLTTLPIRVFMVLSTVGRIPTTAAFSMQGAAFYSRDYALLVIVSGLCILFALAAYLARGPLCRWVEKQNNKNAGPTLR
jgi:uncharacterized membrane protein YdjX (TVP38/TMEM64 family)